MPLPRSTHDPFTTSVPTAASLRNQASQTSLRSSNASAAPTRTRQQHGSLLAPARTRRPISRTTPRVEDGILADSDSERDGMMAPRAPKPQQRGYRHGSPERRQPRSRPQRQQAEEQDIVNRQPDGSYLLGAPALGAPSIMPLYGLGRSNGEVNPEELDAYYAATARKYFAHVGVRQSRQAEDEFERDRPEMMAHLKQQVTQKLENERWLYEPINGMQTGIIAPPGV